MVGTTCSGLITVFRIDIPRPDIINVASKPIQAKGQRKRKITHKFRRLLTLIQFQRLAELVVLWFIAVSDVSRYDIA